MKLEDPFSHIIGNSSAKEQLLRACKQKTIGQCLLFFGLSGVGKRLFADALAAVLLTGGKSNLPAYRKVLERRHPDYHIYSPEGKSGMHSIESIRSLIDGSSYAPFESEMKVYLIEEAHRMLGVSANALLKTLEEPGKKTLFILLSDQKEHLLPTIQSRVRTLYFNSLADEEVAFYLMDRMQLPKEQAESLALASRGSIGMAFCLHSLEAHSPFKDLTEILSQKAFISYRELSKKCTEIALFFEKMKEKMAHELKKEIEKGFQLEELKAKDRQNLEKEVEGALAAKMASIFSYFLEEVIFWFRDEHLIYNGIQRKYLAHKDLENKLREKAFFKEPLCQIRVQKAVQEAWIAFSRGLNLAHVLENLFMKLDFLYK